MDLVETELTDSSAHQTVLSDTILRTKKLSKAFGGQTVLDRVSLNLHRGDIVLLRGDNGSGKTTLLNILTGNLEPDSGLIELLIEKVDEHFAFPRAWWKDLNPFDHFTPERMSNSGVGRTWQSIRLFQTQNILSNIAVATPGQLGENPIWPIFRPAKVHLQEKTNVASVREVLHALRLDNRASSSADRISLGQAKRVAIARAVQAGARILLLDEPLAGLDNEGIRQILNLLKELVERRQLTLVIVEHVFHIPRLLEMVNTVWTLSAGHLIVQTPSEVSAEFGRTADDGLKNWMAKLAGNTEIVDRPLSSGAVLSSFVPRGLRRGKPLLEVENLVAYRGNRLVIGEDLDGQIAGLSFVIHEGEIAVLHAPNGWGKTTLLEALTGLIKISKGTIRLKGRAIESMAPWHRAQLGVSMLQARDQIFSTLTVAETLRLAGVSRVPKELETNLQRKMSSLSGGQKQRVAIACAVETGRDTVLLLDEPFSALDAHTIKVITNLLLARLQEIPILLATPNILALD